MDLLNQNSWNFPTIKWLDKYLDVAPQGFIAGGCFKQIFCGQKVKDIDMFFPSEHAWGEAVVAFEEDDNFRFYYRNQKVVAFKDTKSDVTIELISTLYGSPQEVLDEFDFTITKFAYCKQELSAEEDPPEVEYRCLYHPQFFEHLTLKRLVIDNKCPFPVSTFERMIRYAKYGYFPCRETKKKLLETIHALPSLPDVSSSLYDGVD